MIGYVCVGTNNMDRALGFYDALLGEVGGKRTMELETFKGYANEAGMPMLAVVEPYDGKAATVGNGIMVALVTPSRAAVDKIYAKAMELGAADEGGPGLRGPEDMGFYAAYFRDLDGNKLNAFCLGAA